jgi:hypothetical protein
MGAPIACCVAYASRIYVSIYTVAATKELTKHCVANFGMTLSVML